MAEKFKRQLQCEKTERPHRHQMRKESAMFSNQNIKGPIFPEGRARPLKGGQLLAAQFNQKIKHRGVLYREVGKRNGRHLSRSAVIFKTCFHRFVRSRGTNYVFVNSPRSDRRKILLGSSFRFNNYANFANLQTRDASVRIRKFPFENSSRISAGSRKSNWGNGCFGLSTAN